MGKLAQDILDVLGESEKEMTVGDVHEALLKRGYDEGAYYMVKRTLIRLANKRRVSKHQPPPTYSMPTCQVCKGTGIWETGNNDLPCDCPAGATAMFNQSGVDGLVTGEEVKKHFLNSSPEPIKVSLLNPILATSLPGRESK